MRPKPIGIATYGVDIGKSNFHVVGLSDPGHAQFRRNFRRDALLQFFATVPAALVGMEACPGAQK